MRAVLQRVTHASVTVDGQIVGEIGHGLLILLGIGHGDSEAQVKTLSEKIVHLEGGIFGAYMQVELLNDGPVTLWLDSEQL